MKLFLVQPLLSVFVGYSLAVDITSCLKDEEGEGKIHSFNIENCQDIEPNDDGSKYCELPIGSKVPFEIEFTTNVDFKSFECHVTGALANTFFELPFVGYNPAGCKHLKNSSCPLVKDTKYIYANTIDIKPFFPKLNYHISFKFTGNVEGEENAHIIHCAQFNGTIVDPKSKEDITLVT